MNKLEAIHHHQNLIEKRKWFLALAENQQGEMSDKNKSILKELDSLIGRYGNVHNPKIAIKAAQYIGL